MYFVIIKILRLSIEISTQTLINLFTIYSEYTLWEGHWAQGMENSHCLQGAQNPQRNIIFATRILDSAW